MRSSSRSIGPWNIARPLLPLALLAVFGASVRAQAAPPVQRDCDALFPANQYNDRLDCKTENVNGALFAYVDAALEFDTLHRTLRGTAVFTDLQINSFLTARDRAQNAKNRAHDALLFRAQVAKNKSSDADCYVKEIIGDMGGAHGGDDIQPCEANEDCEEVIGDGIGDDDGICRMHGSNREVCVQVCQQPLATDDDQYDPNIATDTEQGLDEVEASLADATNVITSASLRMRRLAAIALPTNAPTDCDQYQFDLFPGPGTLQATQIVKNVTGAAFNACSVVCNQDAFGFNCEAGCLVLAIVDGIANGINDGFTVVAANNGGAQLDQLARCSTQIRSDIGLISTNVDGNQTSLVQLSDRLSELATSVEALTLQLNALGQVLSARLDHVDQQLCIPQGQRACFPGQHTEASAPLATPPVPGTASDVDPIEGGLK